MEDKKISDFDRLTNPTGSELIPAVADGRNYAISLDDVSNYKLAANLDKIEMSLGWGDLNTLGFSGQTVNLLNISTNAAEYIKVGDEVYVHIERYRAKRARKTVDDVKYSTKSGWKFDKFYLLNNPDRPSEILLTDETIITGDHYFGQDLYFYYSTTVDGDLMG